MDPLSWLAVEGGWLSGSEIENAGGWIRRRLAPFATTVTSVVPGGFAAYARLLHPVLLPGADGEVPLRWRRIAAANGLRLDPESQYHSVALPPAPPQGGLPPEELAGASGPRDGEMYPADAAALVELLGGAGARRCFFAFWDGYDLRGGRLTADGSAVTGPDPLPPEVRDGARLELPGRSYVVYEGPLSCLADAVGRPDARLPNLWWPPAADWCVASEIDLPWTYVGGEAPLVASVLADGRLESLPASPADPLTRVEPWVRRWVDRGVEELLAEGSAVVETPRGRVRAVLDRPAGGRPGALRLASEHPARSGSSWTSLAPGEPAELRRQIELQLRLAVLALA